MSKKCSIKPNTFIVGSAKSGTNSLYEYLKKTENVFFPKIKEPGFLAKTTSSSIADTKENYISLYKDVKNKKILGDASTAYLFDLASPKLIEKFAGKDANIIIILRNPIDMAHSLWKHRMREDGENLSFEKAVFSWDQRIRDKSFLNNYKGWLYNYNYLERAKYYNQVKRFLDRFKNVHIIIFESFIEETRREYFKVCDFLGIEASSKITFKAYNKSGTYKKGLIYNLFLTDNFFKKKFKKILPLKQRTILRKSLKEFIKNEHNFGNINEEFRKKLILLLKDDVKKLNELLSKDLKKYWPEYFAKNG